MHLDKNLWRNGKEREHATFLSCRGVFACSGSHVRNLYEDRCLKTRLECDFWTQLFSFPQKQKATSGQIRSSLAFIFVFIIYLFLYSLPPLWLSENTCLGEGGMIKTSLSKWGEWFPISATRRLCTARTCPLSISSELLGYSQTIYNHAARRLYARLVWNGFT